MHLVYPPQFRVTIAFDFSWDDSNTQGKLEIMVMHNFSGGGGARRIMVCVKIVRGKSLWSESLLTLGLDSSPVVSKLSLLPSSFPSSPSLKSPF